MTQKSTFVDRDSVGLAGRRAKYLPKMKKNEDNRQKWKNEDIYCTVVDDLGIFCVGQDASPWSLNHCFESNNTMSQLSNLFNYSIQCSRKLFVKRIKKTKELV